MQLVQLLILHKYLHRCTYINLYRYGTHTWRCLHLVPSELTLFAELLTAQVLVGPGMARGKANFCTREQSVCYTHALARGMYMHNQIRHKRREGKKREREGRGGGRRLCEKLIYLLKHTQEGNLVETSQQYKHTASVWLIRCNCSFPIYLTPGACSRILNSLFLSPSPPTPPSLPLPFPISSL